MPVKNDPATPSSRTATLSDSESVAIGASALRKASLRLLPVIAVGYGMAYMDRVNVSFASLQMNRDLRFSATAYGVGAGVFFIGYALFQRFRTSFTCCEFGSQIL